MHTQTRWKQTRAHILHCRVDSADENFSKVRLEVTVELCGYLRELIIHSKNLQILISKVSDQLGGKQLTNGIKSEKEQIKYKYFNLKKKFSHFEWCIIRQTNRGKGTCYNIFNTSFTFSTNAGEGVILLHRMDRYAARYAAPTPARAPTNHRLSNKRCNRGLKCTSD